jgi:hypothetical protein
MHDTGYKLSSKPQSVEKAGIGVPLGIIRKL